LTRNSTTPAIDSTVTKPMVASRPTMKRRMSSATPV
jgi:hypothetical protein